MIVPCNGLALHPGALVPRVPLGRLQTPCNHLLDKRYRKWVELYDQIMIFLLKTVRNPNSCEILRGFVSHYCTLLKIAV